VILHEPVEEDLVLITHRGEKGVLEDDGGLLLELVVGTGDPAERERMRGTSRGRKMKPTSRRWEGTTST